jgi:ABC-type glycerol-3-phosphate transport system permease component
MVMPQLAAAVIYTIPLILLFFIGQRYIIQGVVTSGIKG